MLKALLIFAAVFCTDWLWASYIINTAKKNVTKSSVLSGLIVGIGAFTTITYVEDHTMIIPAVIGGMLGTVVGVKYNKD